MRLASFNVENLFARPKAMAPEEGTSEKRAEALAAHAEVSKLLDRASYAGVETQILDLLKVLGVDRSDTGGPYARLRKIRGIFLRRPKNGPVELVAKGRGDWIGWIELKTVPVKAAATRNTARVIDELNADVMVVIEADNRPDLERFSRSSLLELNSLPYSQVMVVEGNDDRGIDVGLLARSGFALREIRTHIYDKDAEGTVFSRDCCEYHLETASGKRLIVMANHFKSKGYTVDNDPQGRKRRARQGARVRDIYEQRLSEGFEYIAIMGDLNDDPRSESLRALIASPGLTDISQHPAFEWNGRRGTYGSGNEEDKIDYILLSESLFNKANGGGVFRKGVWRGSRTKNPWDIFDTLESKEQEASDHAAIYADLDDL